MTENHLSGRLYNELFSEIDEEKCMAWSLTVHKNPIIIYSSSLQAFSFRSVSLSILYPLFLKDNSAIPQPSV